MNKIDMIKALIAKTDDADELKKLNDELIKAIREEEREALKKEMAAETEKAIEAEKVKALQEAKQVSKMAQIPERREPVIEVGTPGLYKGYSLKAAVAEMQHGDASKTVRKLAQASPDKAELVAKWMVDKMNSAKAVTPDMLKGMNETTTTAGGYLTPTEERLAVISYIREVSIAMQEATHMPMTSDVMTIPRENAKVSIAFTSEATDATETTPSLDLVTLTAKRLDAYTKVTNELLQDGANPGGVAGMLAAQFIEAVGQKIDSAVFIGSGDPMSGVFKSAGYSEVFGSGSTNFSALLESNIRNIVKKIIPSYRRNAKWFLSTSALWQYVYGLKDGDERPLYVDISGGGGKLPTLWGYPVMEGNDDIMPSTTAATTGFIVFGDLAGVYIGDRLTDTSLFVDPYSFSRSYQTQFLLFTRWAFAQALPNMLGRIATA
jgi:HK97 family phage major capsid protein